MWRSLVSNSFKTQLVATKINISHVSKDCPRRFSTLLSCGRPSLQNVRSSPKLVQTLPLPIAGCRWMSSSEISSEFASPDVITAAQTIVEPSFQSLGLASLNLPPGWIQALMEQIHVHYEMPWWGTIVATTLLLRITVFPIVLRVQRHMARLNNVLPEYQRLQMKCYEPGIPKAQLIEAKMNLDRFMADNNISEVSKLILILSQGGVFASMFFAIRGMANCPVESMTVGGLYWFTDLTVSDPYFLLPILTSSSLFFHIKFGGDGVDLDSMGQMMRKFMLCMPILCLPFMCQFPAALNLYWLTSNLITICQAQVLKRPSVRSRLGLPEMIRWKPEELPMTNFSFIDTLQKAQKMHQAKTETHLGPYDWRMKQEEMKFRKKR